MAHEGMPVEASSFSPFSAASLEALPLPPEINDHPQDECGVIAVYNPGGPVLQATMQGLHRLQHRGHSGAGISYDMQDVSGKPTVVTHKGTGPVDRAIMELSPTWYTRRADGGTYDTGTPNGFSLDRFQESVATPLAIGHVRYSTAEANDWQSAQPFRGEKTGMTLAHNGHIDNVTEVADLLGESLTEDEFTTDSSQLAELIDARTAKHGSVEAALQEVLPHVEGAYCLTITDGEKVYAARDVWGFHPLMLGKLDSGYAVASEDVAFPSMGAEFIRDIEPGEIVSIGAEGLTSTYIERQEEARYCAFEFIYIAKPESTLDGQPVGEARTSMGQFLAVDHPAPSADFVVGVPNSRILAAQGFAEVAGLEYRQAILKTEKTRTFLGRGLERNELIKRIYALEEDVLRGASIVLVDDSIIKANTMRSLIGRLKDEAGVDEVHLRLAAGRYEHPCYMGMDTHNVDNLIAAHMSDEEIAEHVGATSIGFNSEERLRQSVGMLAGKLCLACTNGDYPIRVNPPTVIDLAMPTLRTENPALASV